MTWLIALGGGGGIVAFVSAILLAVRAIFRNVDATQANTRAINILNQETLPKLGQRVSSLEIKQAVMEDRQRRR